MQHDILPTRDEITLHLIASGLLEVVRLADEGKPLQSPYPPSLQMGADRLAADALARERAYPQDVPELLHHWCRRPLAEWPLNLDEHRLGASDTLLRNASPTGLCEDWARAASDVEAEVRENAMMRSVFTICINAQQPASYVAFRRLLIENPVLTEQELRRWSYAPDLERLRTLLLQAYAPAPLTAIDAQGNLRCCGRCGNLLLQARSLWYCETERCRGLPSLSPTTRREKDGVFWLRRELRRFIAAPGRTELWLFQQLSRLSGLTVTLWPAFDRYDLRLEFADGQAWAVDVKDWADPMLLARRLKQEGESAIPAQPAWTRAFFVFPDERREERPRYRDVFCQGRFRLVKPYEAVYASGLLRLARRKVKEGARCAT